MADHMEFLSGVVEGFYGRSWTLETRLAYAEYLSAAGLNTCEASGSCSLFVKTADLRKALLSAAVRSAAVSGWAVWVCARSVRAWP